MTILVILLPVLLVMLVAVYRNRRDTARLPRVPYGFDRAFGSDHEYGPDSERIRDELILLSRRAA